MLSIYITTFHDAPAPRHDANNKETKHNYSEQRLQISGLGAMRTLTRAAQFTRLRRVWSSTESCSSMFKKLHGLRYE
jgi:hypothetical protein